MQVKQRNMWHLWKNTANIHLKSVFATNIHTENYSTFLVDQLSIDRYYIMRLFKNNQLYTIRLFINNFKISKLVVGKDLHQFH